MKTLLVKLKEPVREGQKACYMPPLGLWSLRAGLRELGDEVEVIDMHMGDEIEGRWDRIGLSVQFSIQHDEYKRMVKVAQEHTEYVFAGGQHAAAVDAPEGVKDVALGPGEFYFGLRYAAPDMSAEELQRYWEKGAPHDLQSKTNRWMSVETSRGCMYKCGFCGVRDFWGKPNVLSQGWERLPSAAVRNHLERLFYEMEVEELFIEDDNATVGGNLDSLLLYLTPFKWSMPNGVRVGDLSPGLLGRMSDHGCWRLSLPFETGSRASAFMMGIGDKYIPFDTAMKVVEDCRSAGIKTCGFFIIGYPGETEADVEETLRYANALPLDDRHIYIATPYPGTRLYDECKERGYLTVDGPELYRALMYNKALIRTPWLDPDVLEGIRARDRRDALRRLGRKE